MIIPLVGLFIACAIFAGIGAAVLSLLSHLRLTLVNLVVFVMGAVPCAFVAAVAYGRVFGNVTVELAPRAVLGLFGVMPVAGLTGGLLAVLAYGRIMRIIPLRQQSGIATNEGPRQAQN